jgi:pyruvate formate lyase activating enzyme
MKGNAKPARDGVVFNIQRFSIQDGPGIRTVVFFKGCNLRCQWCANPESQQTVPGLFMQKQKCIGCRRCIDNCPAGAISEGGHWWQLDRTKCTLCGICAAMCPSGAIELKGAYMSIERVMSEIMRDKLLYANSSGGVTFSGGEPTVQIDFLHALLQRCHEENIHTAIETCGSAALKDYQRIAADVDLFLFDLKLMDTQKHRQYIGTSNEGILRNFTWLAEHGYNVVARCPLIPGINTEESDLAALKKFIVDTRMKEVHLLPYHKLGINKYDSLGMFYPLDEVDILTDEQIEGIKQSLQWPGVQLTLLSH